MNSSRPFLLIDGMNMFVRAWASFPQLSPLHGQQRGGVIGFLKMLANITDVVKPKSIMICWEGGGSQRRRAIFSEYKLNRRPEKLNRFYGDDIPDSDTNRKEQLVLLIKLLKSLPVCQLYASDAEGDDLIAHLCCNVLRNEEKVIASSDKDLYQLLDDKTKLYSLHKKTFVTQQSVFDEFRITAQNFAFAKAIVGDPGDNVPGLQVNKTRCMGFKTVAKKFPFLGTDKALVLQDVIDFCAAHAGEDKAYAKVFELQKELKRNWRLVYLDGCMLGADQAVRINQIIDTFKPTCRKMALMKILIDEGIADTLSIDDLFSAFHCIEGIQYESVR